MQHRYGLAPFAPYDSYPTAYHPPVRGCEPQAGMTGRGGLFEGATLSDAGNICGVRTGTGPVVPMRGWMDTSRWQDRPMSSRMSVVPVEPSRTSVPFSPARLTIGMGEYEATAARPRAIRSCAGPTASYGPDRAPRGGILAGSSIQGSVSAYSDAAKPMAVVGVKAIRNPADNNRVISSANTTPGFPMAGYGAFGTAEQAVVGSAATTPKLIGTSSCAWPSREIARRPRPIGRSVFEGGVYEDGGGVRWINTTPPLTPMPMGGSPDGLGMALGRAFLGLGSLFGFS